MAPYGACEVAQSTARSKAHFEADKFRQGFRRKNESAFEENKKSSEVLSKDTKNMLEQGFRALRCSERQTKHARAVISSAKRPRRTQKACSSSDFGRSEAPKHARAVISSAQWPASTLEQKFRACYAKTLRLCKVFEGSAQQNG
jgi:hypothetical protein